MASPLLRQALSEAAERVPGLGLNDGNVAFNPTRGAGGKTHHGRGTGGSTGRPPQRSRSSESLLAQWARARPSAHLASRRGLVPEILPPAEGADFTVFAQLLGVSVAQARFVARSGEADYPASRTAYDDWQVIANLTDPGQLAMAALAQLVAIVALQLADSPQLPMKVYLCIIYDGRRRVVSGHSDAVTKERRHR